MPWIVLIPLVAILVVAGGVVGAFWMRRSQLRASFGTFECELRRHEGSRWVSCIGRYNDDSLEFLRLWSLTPLPMLVLKRTSLEIVTRSEPKPGELSEVDDDAIVVGLDSDAGTVWLGMSYAAYTGLSAWIEAGPVAGVGTWRQ